LTPAPRLVRLVVILGGVAALVAAFLGVLQIDSSRKSSRAAAAGSRLAVEAFETLTSAGLRSSFESSVIQEQFELETTANAIEGHTNDGIQSGLGAVAAADQQAAARLKRAWAAMIDKPLGLEGGAALLAEQATLKRRADNMVARQNALVEEADKFARRSNGASRGLILVATAGALFTLAISIRERRPAWLALGTGAFVLSAAVVTGVLALLA